MTEEPKLLRVLAGEALDPPPIWIMRQAGRYLGEYRETRRRAGSFLELCYAPDLAAEVTLQPVERFDFDAAILFSDILVVPDALGQAVRFEEGAGPLLTPLGRDGLAALDRERARQGWAPVIETVRLVRRRLAPDKGLIGFCGAPWTVATYMVAGCGTADQAPARHVALADPQWFGRLIDLLVEASIDYLVAQLRAGADVVQIFDSWASVLDDEGFENWAVRPVRRIVEGVRREVPGARIIAFAKGAGGRLGDHARGTGADAAGVDWTLPMRLARGLVPPGMALQGNLDPMRLIVGGAALDRGVDALRADMAGHPHIFNLGHGITPDTPVAHVAQLVRRVRRGP